MHDTCLGFVPSSNHPERNKGSKKKIGKILLLWILKNKKML